jgi:hypothetical protein
MLYLRIGTLAMILIVLVAGCAIVVAAVNLAGAQAFNPGSLVTRSGQPTQVAPLGNYTIWSMPVSNSSPENWNVNISYGFSGGNHTTIIRDGNSGVVYTAVGESCISEGVPAGPCGEGLGLTFTLPPATNHDLEVVVHNNDAYVVSLNDTSVSYSYVAYPLAETASIMMYIGATVIAASLLTLGWKEHFLRRLNEWSKPKPEPR